MKKPTPEEVQQLREAYPQGLPRVDYREMTLVVEPRAAGEGQGDGGDQDDNAPIPIAISSEAPVLRYDWWNDELYYEVLGHTKEEVDLSYSKDGLPFIMSHRAYDGDMQHGIVESVRVEKDGVLRGEVRFSRSVRAQEIRADMLDGIRKKVSVGYIVGDDYDQTSGKGKDDIPTRRYKNWMPMEVSTVPIPADYTVGVGRAQSSSGQAALARFLELHPATAGQRSHTTVAPKAKEKTVENEKTPAAPGGASPSVQVNERANEEAAKRIENITALAAAHGCTDKLTDWIRKGATEFEVRGQINDILAERLKAPVQTSRGVELSEKEHKRFSYARALLQDGALARELGSNVDIGFEKEIIEEARKRTPASMTAGQGGMFVPYVTTKGAAQRAVDSATSTTGGPFKFTPPGDFIDLLRNKTSVMRAGATLLSGLTGPVSFPKQNGAGTASWRGENPGSDLSRADLTTTTVSLAFKTVQAAMAVSRQAIFSAASGNYDIEQIIRNDLAAIIALAIDLGGLNGSGSSNQPLGVLQDTSVGTAAALGSNGGTMAWTNIVDLETAVGDANAEGQRMAYITNTKQRGVGKKIAVLAATASGVPVWGGDPNAMGLQATPGLPADGVVNGYRAIASNQVPRNLTKGTSTTVCSAWVFGAWEHLLIGQFGAGFEVLVDPYTLKLQNLVDLTAWNFVDVANRYPVAFATIKDAL